MNTNNKESNKPKQKPTIFPPQHQQTQPGIEALMEPRPIFDDQCYTGSEKLKDKVAIITGGDSGIGRAVAVAFAKATATALPIPLSPPVIIATLSFNLLLPM